MTDVAALATVLEGARLWGLELDTKFRVLGATIEPDPAAHPVQPAPEDRRLQVVLHPVNVVLASLRRRMQDGTVTLETFTEAQLVDVVDSFDGPVLTGELLDRPAPTRGEWAPRWSMEGRAQVPDGRTHSLTVRLTADGGREFDFYATFDEVVVRDPDGNDVALAG